MAAQTAGAFNPHVRIQPIHANIKEPQFDVEWFQSFDIVLNALDNLGESICLSTRLLCDLLWIRRASTREQDVHGGGYTAR